MGFLDKINYSMIVNPFKQVCKRGHRIFHECPTSWHIPL